MGMHLITWVLFISCRILIKLERNNGLHLAWKPWRRVYEVDGVRVEKWKERGHVKSELTSVFSDLIPSQN